MRSIKDLYKINYRPSSSHTMGPQKAAQQFNDRHPDASSFEVTLYGSLATTGKGHMTDKAILNVLHAPTEIIWKPEIFLPYHPNGMTFKLFNAGKEVTEEWTVYKIGRAHV